ncbi:GL25425 [Drosophila persimilis]|uniref:GL25425 n=1 Tax=Drosophila persimilis TaxID=7234 RepID=B4H8P1_DROPE|nr:GL25425 [Drosophila persimilis]
MVRENKAAWKAQYFVKVVTFVPVPGAPARDRACATHSAMPHNNPATQSKCRWQSKKEEKCQQHW